MNIKIFLVNDQRDAQIPFYVFIYIFNSTYFEHVVLIITRDDEHDVLETCRELKI
jgi:hypothetical protein